MTTLRAASTSDELLDDWYAVVDDVEEVRLLGELADVLDVLSLADVLVVEANSVDDDVVLLDVDW